MRLPPALALAAALGACSGGPSPDYEKARQLHGALVARSPLDPYAQPEMAQVLELLARVPEGSRDAEAARALRQKVEKELRAQAEERSRRARMLEGTSPAPGSAPAPQRPAP